MSCSNLSKIRIMGGLLTAATCLILGLGTGTAVAEEFRVMFYHHSFPPYFFTPDDTRTGINRDLLAAIGKITHDTFTYEYLPFLRAQLMFDNGRIDLETCVNPLWRSKAKVPGVYTIPHGRVRNVVVFGKGKRIPVESPLSLENRAVGVVRGYTYPTCDPWFELGLINKVVATDERQLLEMLRHGRIDQAFMNETLALYWINNVSWYRQLEVGPALDERDIMIRLHPQKKHALKRFDAAIRQLLKSGEINRILAKYR
ncbi:substrate-binding periplasmic protein [Pseudodesulfovibrio sp.]|uniref:substrate-binding periplasmic protein n=1 Tax=unclassified Pseudodesulfovibrio TaxID=2661612 RepID=UPI003B004008